MVRDLIIKIIEPSLENVQNDPDKKNPKGRLQEILQAIVPESPVYKIINESGPDHDKKFEVEVSWSNKILANGSGSNKKEAEAMAAQNAIDTKSWK